MLDWLSARTPEIGAYGSFISGVAALAVLVVTLADRREARRPRLAVSVASFQIGNDPLVNPVEDRPMVVFASQMAAVDVRIHASLELPGVGGQLGREVELAIGSYDGGALAPGAGISAHEVGGSVTDALASRRIRPEGSYDEVVEEIHQLVNVQARLRLTTQCTDFTGQLLEVEEHIVAGFASFVFTANPGVVPDTFALVLRSVTFHGTHVPGRARSEQRSWWSRWT